MATESSTPLAKLTVLVTRPDHQAGPLIRLIEAAGGRALRLPTIEIADPIDRARADAIIGRLERYDVAIFVSANAAERGARKILSHGRPPTTLKIAAVGPRTADVLRRQGIDVEICPAERADSEALLALDALRHVRGRRIVVFRGEGGRELIAETLRRRGAQVDYAEVYRRRRPATRLQEAFDKDTRASIDIIIATSNEGLQNLFDMSQSDVRSWLLSRPLVVASERGAALAAKLGFELEPVIAAGAGDQAILDALVDWRARREGRV